MSTATAESPPIVIRNVGPINRTLQIPLRGPGVYIAKGKKGEGKSTMVRCVESLITGHAVDLTVSDGELDGDVTGFMRVVPIGSKKRARGDFEADALDSEKYAIEDITDPKEKNPAAADARSIRALASLTRAPANVADYYDLVGGKAAFEAIVAKSKTETDDPVLLASRIKEACDAAARLLESQRDTENGHAKSCQEAAEGIDLDGECDSKALAASAERAAARVQELESQVKAAQRAHRESQDANKQLTEAKSGYKGPTLEAAQQAYEKAALSEEEAENEVARLTELLQAATVTRDKAADDAEHQRKALEAAYQHSKLIGQLETLIANQAAIRSPESAEIDEANQALEQARAAQEQGVRIRDAKKSLEKAKQHLAAAEDAGKRAELLRNAARGTFDVLTRNVHLKGLRIESVDGNPRLVVEHPNRKGRKTLFCELSDGERTLTAMRLLTQFLGDKSGGRPIVFPVSQRLFQDLPDSDIREIDAEAKRLGIYVFGARVDDGDLRVEPWGAS